MDQLHPGTGEFSFNCTGTVASCDWIRIELLLPPRHLARHLATAAAAAALQIPRISASLSLSPLFSLTSLKVELNDLPFVHPLPLKSFYDFGQPVPQHMIAAGWSKTASSTILSAGLRAKFCMQLPS